MRPALWNELTVWPQNFFPTSPLTWRRQAWAQQAPFSASGSRLQQPSVSWLAILRCHHIWTGTRSKWHHNAVFVAKLVSEHACLTLFQDAKNQGGFSGVGHLYLAIFGFTSCIASQMLLACLQGRIGPAVILTPADAFLPLNATSGDCHATDNKVRQCCVYCKSLAARSVMMSQNCPHR